MPDFVIVTGMSGAGLTEAMHDLGYFCVDNLPSSLLGDLVRVNEETESTDDCRRLAVVCDSRNGDFFGDLEAELAAMEEAGISYKTLFLDAAQHHSGAVLHGQRAQGARGDGVLLRLQARRAL